MVVEKFKGNFVTPGFYTAELSSMPATPIVHNERRNYGSEL